MRKTDDRKAAKTPQRRPYKNSIFKFLRYLFVQWPQTLWGFPKSRAGTRRRTRTTTNCFAYTFSYLCVADKIDGGAEDHDSKYVVALAGVV